MLTQTVGMILLNISQSSQMELSSQDATYQVPQLSVLEVGILIKFVLRFTVISTMGKML